MASELDKLDLNDPKCVSSIIRLIESHISSLQDELAKEKRMRQAAEARYKNLQMLFQSAKNECCCKLQPVGLYKSSESVELDFGTENRCTNQSFKGIANKLRMDMISPSVASSTRPTLETKCSESVKQPQQKQISYALNTENCKPQLPQLIVENMDLEISEISTHRSRANNTSLKERNYINTAIEKQRMCSIAVGKSQKAPSNNTKFVKRNLKLSLNCNKNRSELKTKISSQIIASSEKIIGGRGNSDLRHHQSEDLFKLSDSDSDSSTPVMQTRNNCAVYNSPTPRPLAEHPMEPLEHDELNSIVFGDTEESDTDRTQFNIKQAFDVDCKDCQRFVDFLGADLTIEKAKKIVEKCKRHRHDIILQTPDDYWNPEMIPDNGSETLIDYRFVKK